MKKNFQDCLQRLLKDEGGYTNDPNDSGGATKYGITITDVRKYIKRNATPEDVKNLTVEQASEIYKTRYWDALDCDSLSSGVDYTVFDYGVNSGLGRPRKALQTFSKLSGTSLVQAINNERTAFLRNLAATQPKNQKFLRGWLSRVNRVNDYSLQLAKTDNVSGPAGGVVAGAGAAYGLWHYMHDWLLLHPYITTASVLGMATAVGLLIHYIRNK